MGFDIITFLGERIIVLIAVSVILAIVIVTLTIIQKKLRKKIVFKEETETKENILIKEIESLKASKTSSEDTLNSINKIARNYFTETFRLRKNLEYSEMINLFKGKNRNSVMMFCQQMLKALYSGEKVEEEKLNDLINNLETIIKEEKPSIKEEIDDQNIIIPLGNKEEYDIITTLSKKDIKNIEAAYKKLQKLYDQVYENTKKSKSKENIEKLMIYRKMVIKKINNYIKDPKKDANEFAEEISRGATFLSLFNKIDSETEEILIEPSTEKK